MATTASITSSYAGKDSAMYVKAALLSGNTLSSGKITILPNVKYKTVLHRLLTDGLLKDASCDFTATSTVTLNEKVLTPKEVQVNLQLCKSDFVSTWESEEMGMSAHDVLPKSFSDFLIAYVLEKVSAQLETAIWTGATGTSGSIDGFMTQLTVDAALPTANEVAGTTVTAANVIEELRKISTAIPSTLFGRDDLYLYVSQNIYRAYIQALGGFSVAATSNNGVGNNGTQWYNGQELTFDGVKVFCANGLASNTAIATTVDNLFFATGLQNDMNLVKLLDMSDLDGSQNVRFIMRATAAVGYHSVGDIITYGITNAAN
jgi:galactitol-specific phosphotransferase system IIB component